MKKKGRGRYRLIKTEKVHGETQVLINKFRAKKNKAAFAQTLIEN